MKKILALAVGLAAAFAVTISPAHAVNIGEEGCTPGYWKNHPESWQEAGPLSPNTPLTYDHPAVNIVPFAPTSNDLNNDGQTDTFLDALSFQGGPGLKGAERILFRAAVAAWLNAAHEGVGYPLRRADFVPMVNAAIASGDRDTMLALATQLDDFNNLGCPL